MGIQRQDMRAASKIPQPKTGTDSKVIQCNTEWSELWSGHTGSHGYSRAEGRDSTHGRCTSVNLSSGPDRASGHRASGHTLLEGSVPPGNIWDVRYGNPIPCRAQNYAWAQPGETEVQPQHLGSSLHLAVDQIWVLDWNFMSRKAVAMGTDTATQNSSSWSGACRESEIHWLSQLLTAGGTSPHLNLKQDGAQIIVWG